MNYIQVRLLFCFAVSAICMIFLMDTHSGIRPAHISWINSEDSKLRNISREFLAYMTFLAGTVANLTDPDISHDVYFDATRMLGYQLLHNKHTKTRRDIPFVVMVTEDVSQEKRDRLTDDGATVIPVDYLVGQEWLTRPEARWRDVVTKLRAWKLVQYSRVLFIDGDTLINHCLDGVFEDSAAQIKAIVEDGQSEFENDQSHQFNLQDDFKSDYVLASLPETKPGHSYPPEESQYKDPSYLTAGFFLFSPSMELFNFYVSLMVAEGRFDSTFPEQNLLNYAHRKNGRMPWQRLSPVWNINFPTTDDKDKGVASMHEKWWTDGVDGGIHRYMLDVRWSMESFYEGRDLGLIE